MRLAGPDKFDPGDWLHLSRCVDDDGCLEPATEIMKTFRRGALDQGDTVRDRGAGDFRLVRLAVKWSRGEAA